MLLTLPALWLSALTKCFCLSTLALPALGHSPPHLTSAPLTTSPKCTLLPKETAKIQLPFMLTLSWHSHCPHHAPHPFCCKVASQVSSLNTFCRKVANPDPSLNTFCRKVAKPDFSLNTFCCKVVDPYCSVAPHKTCFLMPLSNKTFNLMVSVVHSFRLCCECGFSEFYIACKFLPEEQT
jgi:hypothetical protein